MSMSACAFVLFVPGAMNSKGVVSGWSKVVTYPVFLLIDVLLSIPPVAQ